MFIDRLSFVKCLLLGNRVSILITGNTEHEMFHIAIKVKSRLFLKERGDKKTQSSAMHRSWKGKGRQCSLEGREQQDEGGGIVGGMIRTKEDDLYV